MDRGDLKLWVVVLDKNARECKQTEQILISETGSCFGFKYFERLDLQTILNTQSDRNHIVDKRISNIVIND